MFFPVKHISLIFLFLSIIVSSNAEQVVVSGKALSFKNKKIAAYTYDDNFTLTEKLLAAEKIDSTGCFNFNFFVDHTTIVIFKTNNTISQLYVEPGKTYTVVVGSILSDAVETYGREVPVSLSIESDDSLEVNYTIGIFNQMQNNFYEQILFPGMNKDSLWKSFNYQLQARFNHLQSAFLQDYINYNIALMSLYIEQKKSEKIFYTRYFNRHIPYESYEYMRLIEIFFKGYEEKIALFDELPAVLGNTNQKENYTTCIKYMSKADTLLKNDTLRELLLIKGLQNFYYKSYAKKILVETLLDYIVNNGLTFENKKIAHNILSFLTKLKPDSPAPEIEMYYMNTKKVILADFKGKYVYLNFWATWCIPCLQEISLFQKLQEKYKKSNIVILNILMDENIEAMKELISKNNYTMIFLYPDNAEEVKKNYNLKALPSYVLIDTQGNLLQSSALGPTKGIEKTFYEITNKKSKVQKDPEID